jgi:hypothetical protein
MSKNTDSIYIPPYRDLRQVTEQPKDYDTSGYDREETGRDKLELLAGGIICGFVLFLFVWQLTA